jgi:nuclear receptor interaction protein
MKYSLQDRMLKREYGGTSRYSKIQGIYADRQFLGDMDIVNELNGHSGCVNALRYANVDILEVRND